MSYGGQSNAPWGRNVMQGHPQSGGFHQNSQQMFMQNAQQNNMAAFGHGGMQGGGSGNMYPSGGGNSVSYPQPRSGLNPVAFQQGGVGQSHYNSIGTVTKVSNDCGLINDEIFFYRNVCKGPEPKLGDRVIFESAYSSNGQFKWNATRVQLMQPTMMGSSKGSYGSVAPMNDYQRGQTRYNSPIRGGRHERDRLHRSRDRDEDEHERKRRREERSRDRITAVNNRGAVRAVSSARIERERGREESRKREREITDRERIERERARGKEILRAAPKGRGGRGRPIRRYMVQIPKALLVHKSADVQDLRRRYTTLYIPSDFFHASIKWCDTFTPDNPFSLRRPCQFHIMHKDIDSPIEQNPELLEPADSNYLYSAKVMLMALPSIADIYKKSFESEHPSRLINFLVGVRGCNEPMAIGGPWSPSLDGENPDKDPTVLIRTAIRTCKALTGVDLSNCTQWYRFVELYYHRTEYKNMEKDGPPRVETVVIYLPDVHSCLPSTEEWQTITQVYKNAADDIIARKKALKAANNTAANDDDNDGNEKTDDVEMLDNSTLPEDGADEKDESSEETTQNNDNGDGDGEQEDEEMEDSNVSENATTDVNDSAAVDNNDTDDDDDAAEDEQNDDVNAAEAADDDDDDDENEEPEPAPEPTHYSLLDLKTMKIQEIRDELLARNLPDTGVRNVVMARLAKALNTEKAEETKNKVKKTPQKTEAAKKSNESVNKATTTTKAENKKSTDDNKKKQEKDPDVKSKSNDKKAKPKTSTDKKTAEKTKKDEDEQEDFDMNDIVILDEYDSSKNPEDEKEKDKLSRSFNCVYLKKLPSKPQIIVHPNKIAKDGKFDCAIMSLSVLLDYHPDDTKERFFEVSLFAELFNEMLMRDFAFNIYKEIYLYEDKSKTDVKVEDDDKKATNDKIKKEVKDNEIKENDNDDDDDEKDKSSEKELKSSTSANEMNTTEKPIKEEINEEAQSIKSESRKRKLSTSTSTANAKERESTVTEKKMVVVKPQLLLSFIYFDTTHCGYIFEKDLEDLFTVLGLNLSRAQIQSVLGKLTTRQTIYYRKLTDKEESLDSTPSLEDVDDLPTEILKEISAGNNQFEEVFGKPNNEALQVSAIDAEEDNKDGLVNFNGTVVHVGKLVSQIKRTEKSFSDLEKLYNDLFKQQSDLQKKYNKSSGKISDLQSEIKNVSRKLTDTNQDLHSLNRKYKDQNSTLSYIYTRVAPYFIREKNKDKDAKTEGSRDKDKDDKEKEKSKGGDKDSDKEKEKVKDDKEKEKVKDDKEKKTSKDDKEKAKLKDDKEKETSKDDKEKEKSKDDKEKEKSKDDKEKEKSKDEKEKVKLKDDKEKEKSKDDKAKEKFKDGKEKENVKNDVENIKTEKESPIVKDDKEKSKDVKDVKEKAKDIVVQEKPKDGKEKEKPTTENKELEKPKDRVPVVSIKKLTNSKPAGKVTKKINTPKK